MSIQFIKVFFRRKNYAIDCKALKSLCEKRKGPLREPETQMFIY